MKWIAPCTCRKKPLISADISTWEGVRAAEISPDLLEQMERTPGEVTRRLNPETAKNSTEQKLHLDEKTFRWMHNEDAMASDKLSEGIRKFYADARKLEQCARSKLAQKRAG